MNVDLPVRLDHEQSVEADRAGHIGADDGRYASHLAAPALAVVSLSFLPPDELGAAMQRVADACGGDPLSWAFLGVREAEQGAFPRGIDFSDRDFVDAELLCG